MERLAVICPVTQSANRLDHVESWLPIAIAHNISVIIVHDYRDEETSVQLRNLLDRHQSEQVVLIEGVFGSAGQARNAGLERVKSEWVAFWDSDDDPDVEQISRLISKHKTSDVIIGQFKICTRYQSGKTSIQTVKPTHKLLDVVTNPGLWRFIFRIEAIRGISFPSFPLGEDQAFLAQICWSQQKVEYTNSICYTYFQGNPSQLTSDTLLIPRLHESIAFLESLLTRQYSDKNLIAAMMLRQSLSVFRSIQRRNFLELLCRFIAIFRVSFQQTDRRMELLKQVFFG